tara:strand:+ start:4500 stop:4892 length:393 start_codon:yes stop_codon:yes gene_type:complete
MFFLYNYSNFPIVNVSFNGYINSDEEFKLFTNEWLKIYEKKTDFNFIFDTKNLSGSNIKYTFYMAFFIKRLKQLNYSYLKSSKIYIYNNYIYNFAKIIFYFEAPIAPIELILYNNDNKISSEIINPTSND